MAAVRQQSWGCRVYPIKYAHGFVVFCFVLFCFGYVTGSQWIHVVYLLISFRVTSLALGQSYDCPSASEVTLKDMDTINLYQTTTKQKPCAYCLAFRAWRIPKFYLRDFQNYACLWSAFVEYKKTCLKSTGSCTCPKSSGSWICRALAFTALAL